MCVSFWYQRNWFEGQFLSLRWWIIYIIFPFLFPFLSPSFFSSILSSMNLPFADVDSNCDRDSGWIAAGNHIHSGENYADDVYLILTLDVTEFLVGGSYFEGQDTVVAEITFAFAMDCHQDCSLYFLEELETSSPQFLATWTGKTNQTTIFTWGPPSICYPCFWQVYYPVFSFHFPRILMQRIFIIFIGKTALLL